MPYIPDYRGAMVSIVIHGDKLLLESPDKGSFEIYAPPAISLKGATVDVERYADQWAIMLKYRSGDDFIVYGARIAAQFNAVKNIGPADWYYMNQAPHDGYIEVLDYEVNPRAGWENVSGNNWTFDAPPGAAFNPLEFTNLVIGDDYKVTFTAGGDLNINFLFRPGELGIDLAIDSAGDYERDFTAQNSNGQSRFLHRDVTGVNQVTLSALRIFKKL